eukprot:m.12182 g.12182  ORF g.12182 m.12182 type:complete len:85 (+) comp3211_c0_seq1:266-520(+)
MQSRVIEQRRLEMLLAGCTPVTASTSNTYVEIMTIDLASGSPTSLSSCIQHENPAAWCSSGLQCSAHSSESRWSLLVAVSSGHS